jgi:hypothetical protein
MKAPVCRLCHEALWGNCEGVTPSKGEPRVVTRQILAPEHVYRLRPTTGVSKPRTKPTWPPSPQPSSSAPSAPSPSSPVSPPASTSSDVPSTATNPDTTSKATEDLIKLLRKKIAELNTQVDQLNAEVANLKRRPEMGQPSVTKSVTKTPGVTVTKSPRVTKTGRPSSGNALTASEKQKAYRERKKSAAKIPGKSTT